MKRPLPFVLILNLFFLQTFSQTALKSSYDAYTELPREVVYLHLNKTTLVKGEDLGFTAYVTDKASKQPSQATKNLYCVVTDKNDSIVKQQLLKVEQGITSGIIKIDSLFTSGHYTVKAYTNYMRNFKERNHFIQQIRVIDPDKETEIIPVKTPKQLDVQLLPEGGHLVAGIPNVMGVIAKDTLGFGVGNLTGVLKDSQDNIITDFKLNHLGIGRFLITPKQNNNYHVELNTEHSKNIPITNIDDKGISVQLTDMGNKVALVLQTNTNTHNTIKNENYTLTIHNGHQLEILPVSFQNQKFTSIFNKTDLFSGVNIFTLFNQDNKPILERLYFNYEGISISQSVSEPKVINIKDTARVTLSYKDVDPNKFNNFSISVLPAGTKSYGAHHNIISQTHLQPYVRGYIEDAQYYFSNITKKKQYELDNLLLTQGWSAYNWDDVFNNPPEQKHNFDTGISLKVIAEQKKNQQLWVHAISGSEPEFLNFTKAQKGFVITDKYPIKGGDSVKISKVQKAGHLIVPKVRLESYPNTISRLEDDTFTLTSKMFNRKQQTVLKVRAFDKSLLSTTQKLDEVVVKATKDEERRTKIKAIAQGRVDFFNEGRNNFPTFASYIQARGFRYDIVSNTVVHHRTKKAPAFYINGDRVIGNGPQLQDLYLLPLNRFDYVVTNRGKIDFPYFGKGIVTGVIQIYLRDRISIKDIRRRSSKFMPPLAFEPKKTFYSPKYQNYQDAFFKEYGVIHWLPENSLNEKGELKITFPSLEHREINLFIEGVAENGTFISETKVLTLIKNK